MIKQPRSAKKASLVVCVRRIHRPWRIHPEAERWQGEAILEDAGESLVGAWMAVLLTVPGAFGREVAADMPLALVLMPDGTVFETGLTLSGIASNSRLWPAGKRGDELEKIDDAIADWLHGKGRRWELESGPKGVLWREVSKIYDGNSADWTKDRVARDERRTQRAERAKRDHELEVERVLGKAT